MVLRATGTLGSADLEAILEAAVDVPEVGGAAGTGGLASLGLLTPVDCIPTILVSQCSIHIHTTLSAEKYFHRQTISKGCRDIRTLAGLSSRVTAVGAGRLLDVVGPAAWIR